MRVAGVVVRGRKGPRDDDDGRSIVGASDIGGESYGDCGQKRPGGAGTVREAYLAPAT